MKRRKKSYNLSDISPNNATTFYLHEVYAIPKEIRNNYLKKLLNRKNAAKQKNVRLVKIIYSIIEIEDFDSWNPLDICNKTGIVNINQLYWHRSKILKDLRNMFFVWKEKEREIEESKEYRVFKKNNNEVEMLMMKIRKMEEIGMRKEAKHLLYRIVNEHENRLRKNNPLILSEVYEFLIDYYSAQGNLGMFNQFYRKLKMLFEYSNQSKTLKPKKISLIKLRYLLAEAAKNIFHSHSISHASRAKEFLDGALYLAKKYRCWDYQLLILAKLKNIIQILPGIADKREIHSELVTTGFNIAIKKGLKLQGYAFRSEMVLFDIPKPYTNNQKAALLKKIYENVSELNPVSWWTLICSNNYSASLMNIRSVKSDLIYTDILKLTVLHSFRTTANLYYFGREYNKLMNNVENLGYYYPIDYQYNFKTQNSGFIINELPNKDVLIKLESLLDKTIVKTRNTNQIELKTKLLLASLAVEFQKGIDFNYEKATSLEKKIERVFKKWEMNKSSLLSLFNFFKIGLNMFEGARLYNAKEQVLSKYLKPFSDLSNELIQNNFQTLNIGKSYLSICHIARELNYKELWEVVKEQWNYLEKQQPQIIESLKRQLKEQQEHDTVAA